MCGVTLSKKKACQGMDGMNLEYTLGLAGMENLYLPEKELKNEANNTIVKIDVVGGKIRAYVNAVHSIRLNNIKPFGIADTIKLELVRNKVTEFIHSYLQEHLQDKYSDEFASNMKVTALECNITLPCVGGATSSDVIHLLDMSLDRTVTFRKRKRCSKCEKVNTGVQFTKPKEYRLKIYDKTDEQREKGNVAVESNLLRIECVFIDRSLKRMYGEKRTLRDILSTQAIEILCKEYKRVLIQDIIDTHIKPYLTECKNKLVESLTTSDSGHEISDTVMRHRELIVDDDILRKALKDWYKIRNANDISKQVIYQYRKKGLELPVGVLKTIKTFHTSAG